MNAPARMIVHPSFDALYYSFYIEGLRRYLLDRRRQGAHAPTWHFSSRGFPELGHHCLALRIEPRDDQQPEHKLYISAGDGPGLNLDALAWCDVYAKVNLDPEQIPETARRDGSAAKLLAIGPSFPVRVWNPVGAAWQALRTVLHGAHRNAASPREHLANYWRQWRYRLPETAYAARPGDPDYVFFTSTLWKKQTHTNELRAAFIRACRSIEGLHFEGGFAPRRGSAVPGFEDCTAARRVSLVTYVQGIQRSLVAFNTPAVKDCHGWKLGEFLALGKAIVTTPLTRALPVPLEHGTHLHVVGTDPGADIEDELRRAVLLLRRDHDYRRHLEHNARAYYDAHLSPERVMERCWDALQNHS